MKIQSWGTVRNQYIYIGNSIQDYHDKQENRNSSNTDANNLQGERIVHDIFKVILFFGFK